MHDTRAHGLRAVVFDWAGTMVDYGSLAPLRVFIEVFREFGVQITPEEARAPMGLPKREHIRALGRMHRIAAAWEQRHGRPFEEVDADRIFAIFAPRNREVVAHFAEPVPGAIETVSRLRERGLRIGSTTGYTRDIMEELFPAAAALGYAPDNLVCADEVPVARPSPLMMYKCFIDLCVWPAAAVIKVDDTAPGIAEGLAAGAWTVAVSVTGNAFGLPADEVVRLPEAEFIERRAAAAADLQRAGAHYVIDSVADLMPVVQDIEEKLHAGLGPGQ
jgi:phosphonoacetaldehyde hydrolase